MPPCPLDVLARVLVILQRTRQVALVSAQIEVAVTAQAEQDDAALAFSLAARASSIARGVACEDSGAGMDGFPFARNCSAASKTGSAGTPLPRCSRSHQVAESGEPV